MNLSLPTNEEKFNETGNVSAKATVPLSHEKVNVSKGDLFLLMDSRGDFWKVKSTKGEIVSVPCEILAPVN